MKTIVICDKDRNNAACIKKVLGGHMHNEQREIFYYKDRNSLENDLEKFDSQIDVLFTSVTFDIGTDGIQLAQDVMTLYPRCQVIFMEELHKYNSGIYDVAHVFFLKNLWTKSALRMHGKRPNNI